MKRVLITGAQGFIGQHLARKLSQCGNLVAGLGHGDWSKDDSLENGITFWVKGNVTIDNLDIASSLLGGIDTVFHLAGGSSVGPSLLYPKEDFQRSVISTLELLEWVRISSRGTGLVLASSAAVYGGGYSEPIHVDGVTSPKSPYGFHKRMAEQLFESYAYSFGIKTAVVRLFSVYGPGLKKQLLWDICERLKNNSEQLQLGGTGNELRDWIHVNDATNILSFAAHGAAINCPYLNGGTGIATSVRDIASHLCKLWGNAVELKFTQVVRNGDPKYLVADMSNKIYSKISPRLHWQAGISDYVLWYKKNLTGYKS